MNIDLQKALEDERQQWLSNYIRSRPEVSQLELPLWSHAGQATEGGALPTIEEMQAMTPTPLHFAVVGGDVYVYYGRVNDLVPTISATPLVAGWNLVGTPATGNTAVQLEATVDDEPFDTPTYTSMALSLVNSISAHDYTTPSAAKIRMRVADLVDNSGSWSVSNIIQGSWILVRAGGPGAAWFIVPGTWQAP